MMQSDDQLIYKMQLHECLTLKGGAFSVTRVAAGWIYDFVPYNGYKGGMVFVPFDNSLQYRQI